MGTRRENNRSGLWASLIILTLFTLLTFVNSWPDALVFDDKVFLGPDARHRVDSIEEAFKTELWKHGGGLYRPLLSIDFELQNRAFGSWSQGYHLVNIFLHLLTTLTLFGFLRYFIRVTWPDDENYQFVALLAALIFAVHPMHTEVVNSVFNKSSMYVSLAAVGGLWWLHANLEERPFRAWLGFGLIYSAAILFKESALVLPGIAVTMILLFTGGDLKTRIRRFLPVFWLLIPIALYFWARAMAIVPPEADAAGRPDEFASVIDDTQLVFNPSGIFGISQFGQGLKILLWPYPSRLYYPIAEQFEMILYVGLQVAFIIWALYLWARGRPMLVFALIFYHLALLPSVRIISLEGELPHMAERYLYFPSVGLTFALAAGIRKLTSVLQRKHVLVGALAVILALAAITWNRNADWQSEAHLFETEYQIGSRGGVSLRVLIAAHYNFDRYDRVAEICDENPAVNLDSYVFVVACSSSYLHQKRTKDAIAALEAHAQGGEQWIEARIALASIYKMLNQYQKVVDQYAAIIDGVEDRASKDLYKGEMLMDVFPDDRQQLELARSLFQQALDLNPELGAAEIRLEQVNEKLRTFDAD